ncbi:hypothetical protein T11_17135 [Trichinella zimbabwensis]|uniref:Uncharacterized protein n=1 Tax=Trichinella zimbabwensis TaxID=268475 RepID=A0A0V1I884_9BILA|nr:hypothetical protein T11_17135 [Trichinella zimbabwensis]
MSLEKLLFLFFWLTFCKILALISFLDFLHVLQSVTLDYGSMCVALLIKMNLSFQQIKKWTLQNCKVGVVMIFPRRLSSGNHVHMLTLLRQLIRRKDVQRINYICASV